MKLQPISKNKLTRFRKLLQKKYRSELGLYMISGVRAVREALKKRRLPVEAVLVQEEQTALLNTLPTLPKAPVFVLTNKEFASISEEKVPQGLALVVTRPDTSMTMASRPGGRLLFLQEISEPGNLGTIIRSASWFGWRQLLIGENSVDPFHPRCVRASAGTIVHVEIYEQISEKNLAQLKEHGYSLLAFVPNGGTELSLFPLGRKGKLVAVFGSEAHGLSDSLIAMCDDQITIPRKGPGESLNLAMAVSCFLYQSILA